MKPADIRRERLARYIAEGLSTIAAGRKAGFVSDVTSRRVAGEPGVQARIAEIVAEGYSATLRDAAALDEMLDEMLEADPRCYFDEDGRMKGIQELRNAEAMALTSIKETQFGCELKFESKLAVLQLAMKRRGMLIERQEVSSKSTAEIEMTMNPQQAAEIYKAML